MTWARCTAWQAKVPFVGGPHLNIYSQPTLVKWLANLGATLGDPGWK